MSRFSNRYLTDTGGRDIDIMSGHGLDRGAEWAEDAGAPLDLAALVLEFKSRYIDKSRG